MGTLYQLAEPQGKGLAAKAKRWILSQAESAPLDLVAPLMVGTKVGPSALSRISKYLEKKGIKGPEAVSKWIEKLPKVKSIKEAVDVSDQHELGSAAIKDAEDYLGFHVTDDPSKVERVLSENIPIEGGRADGKYGDLGKGFYFSAAPEVWMGRSTGKWDFLKTLDNDQKTRLLDYLSDQITKMRGGPGANYISQPEQEWARQMIENVRSGTYPPGHLVGELANQPYNIAFWKPEILEPLGIKTSKPPQVVPVKVSGPLAEFASPPDEEVISLLKEAGVPGGYVRADFSQAPQAVIWDNDAIKEFAKFKREKIGGTNSVPIPGAK